MRLGMDVLPSLGSEDALERHTFFWMMHVTRATYNSGFRVRHSRTRNVMSCALGGRASMGPQTLSERKSVASVAAHPARSMACNAKTQFGRMVQASAC